jgi:CPA2 family monovalent cation:H+ antiporter-2
VQECILPERAACAGRSIADLAVRSRFGCSIVEIDRQGHTIIAPEPTQPLYSGDRLLLLGGAENIASARLTLGAVAENLDVQAFDHARLEAIKLPDGPHLGQTLAQLQIPRHTGVLVTAINRDGHPVINPSGSETLVSGDELLVLGSPAQIRTFREWVTQGESAGK